MATLADVAARAGCSTMTASRALSGRGYVSDLTREAVLAAAAELEYIPNEVARSLRSNRSRTVALVISDIENGFYASIARAAERALVEEGYRLLVSNTDEDPRSELEVLRGLREMRAAGLLITPSPDNRAGLADLVANGTPVIQLDRAVEGLACPSVLLDNVAASRAAVDHLVAHGHRRIVVITGPHATTTGAERAEGALLGGRRADQPPEVLIIPAPSYLHGDPIDSVHTALEGQPTAILAGNSVVLEACLEVFAERRIRVPDDISLVCFDDVPWMRWVNPPITALRQPIESMTTTAVELLLSCLAGEQVDVVPRRFAAQLIRRESVSSLEPRITAARQITGID